MAADRDQTIAAFVQGGGFTATMPVPPLNGWTFDREDVDELGLDLCIRVAERTKEAKHV